MPERSDAALIGESWAAPELFGLIFDRHFAEIHRYLARRLSTEDADDLAGEVFRIAFEKRRSFDPSRKSALPWLFGITSNLVLKHHRRQARALKALARQTSSDLALSSDGNGEALADARLDSARSRERLVAALERLKPDERELVMLAAFAELSYSELAEATGLPVGTVRSKLSRTKAKLRERLDPSGKELLEPSTQTVSGGRR